MFCACVFYDPVFFYKIDVFVQKEGVRDVCTRTFELLEPEQSREPQQQQSTKMQQSSKSVDVFERNSRKQNVSLKEFCR